MLDKSSNLESLVEKLRQELQEEKTKAKELQQQLEELKYVEDIVKKEMEEEEKKAKATVITHEQHTLNQKVIEDIFELSQSDGLLLISKEFIERDNGGMISYANTKAFEILRKNGKFLNEMNETEIDWANPIGVSVYRLFKSSSELRAILRNIKPGQIEVLREIRLKNNCIIKPMVSAIFNETGDVINYVLILIDLTYEYLAKDLSSSFVSSIAETSHSLGVVDFRSFQVFHNSKALRDDMDVVATSMTELSQSISDLANSTQDLAGLQNKLESVVSINNQNVNDLFISFDAMGEVLEHLNIMLNNLTPILKEYQSQDNDISDIIMLIEMLQQIIEQNKENTSKIKNSVYDLSNHIHIITDMISKQSSATEEQSEVVRTLAYRFHDLTDRMNLIYDEILSLKTEIKNTVNAQEWNWSKLIKSMRSSNEKLVYEKLMDSVRYIFDVLDALSGTVEWKPKSHTECQFGMWYYQDGKEMIIECGNREVRMMYDSLEDPHMRLHKTEKEMQSLYLEDKDKDIVSKALIEKADEFISYQKELINKLIELAERVREKCNS
ncbi:MAG: CZB domain-containing protein [Thermoproteota archaeon]